MSGELEITRTNAGGVEIVKFQGEITADNSSLLTAGVAEMLARGEKLIIFDVREVSYISSVGIGALTQSHANLAAAGGRLAVVHPDGVVKRVFQLTHMESILHLYEDEAAALHSFTG